MKQIKSLMSLGLIATTLLTACGKPTPLSNYVPTVGLAAPTTVTSPILPTVQVQNNQPTLPDGKKATDIRFDMQYDSVNDTSAATTKTPTPKASATPAPGAAAAASDAIAPQANEMNVPIGTTKQFSVEITLDDKTKLSSYTRVNWVSTNMDVGTVSTAGVFTPKIEGTTKLIASIGGVAVTMVVHVTPGNFIWQQFQSPTKANLNGVKLVSDTEAWAVGAGGTILHYLNGQWYDVTQQAFPQTQGATLYSLDMVSPFEGWAVGDNTILHFFNGIWQRVPTPVQGTFKSVDMIAPGVGYIVGESGGSGVAMRFMGNLGWQPLATGIDKPLNSVSVLGPNSVWAVGDSGNLQRPGIWQFNGTTWEKVRFTNSLIDLNKPTGKYSMKAIKMVNSSQGWAVGAYDPLLSSLTGKRGALYKYDAIQNIWSEVPISTSTDKRYAQVTYNAIGMLTPNEGWVLGNTITAALDFSANNEINGNLMKTDGNTISPASDFKAQALPTAFNSIDVVEHGNGIIVGDQGLIMHRQYDLNYQNKRSNFSNFNGQVPVVGQPVIGAPVPMPGY